MGELPPPLPPPEPPKAWLLPWTRRQKLAAVIGGFTLGALVLLAGVALDWPDNVTTYGALAGLLLPIAIVDVSNRLKGRGGI